MGRRTLYDFGHTDTNTHIRAQTHAIRAVKRMAMNRIAVGHPAKTLEHTHSKDRVDYNGKLRQNFCFVLAFALIRFLGGNSQKCHHWP